MEGKLISVLKRKGEVLGREVKALGKEGFTVVGIEKRRYLGERGVSTKKGKY